MKKIKPMVELKLEELEEITAPGDAMDFVVGFSVGIGIVASLVALT